MIFPDGRAGIQIDQRLMDLAEKAGKVTSGQPVTGQIGSNKCNGSIMG